MRQVFKRANELAASVADSRGLPARPQYVDSTESDFTFQYSPEVRRLAEKIRVDVLSKEDTVWADVVSGNFTKVWRSFLKQLKGMVGGVQGYIFGT